MPGEARHDTPETPSPLFVDYMVPDGALRGLNLGAGGRCVGRSDVDRSNSTEVPNCRLSDAGVHRQRNRCRIAVTAQNLLDRAYVSGCYGPDGRFCGDPRRTTASLSRPW